MLKFSNQMRKIGARSLKDLEKETEKNQIFYKYLKSLSSRATIILLKFSEPEFKTILSNKQFNLNITDSLYKVI